MMYPASVRLTDGRDKITFGTEEFVLHDLDMGAAELSGGAPTGRSVTFSGYILPAGETADARAARMEVLARRLRRIVSGAEGFTLTVGDRSILLLALRSPVFAHEAPLVGDEASFFTVYAAAARPEDAYYLGAVRTAILSGWQGNLIFPMAVTEDTVFACRRNAGTAVIDNPGDADCGFVAVVTAEGGEVSSFALSSSAGEELFVEYPLGWGETLVIDTRPGQKAVTAGGVSILSAIRGDSAFFALSPGENRIGWQCEGAGSVSVRVTLTPRYL